MAVDEAPAADADEMGDDGPAASAEPSAGPTPAEYQASYGVFKAAFNVPLGLFDASRWARASAGEELSVFNPSSRSERLSSLTGSSIDMSEYGSYTSNDGAEEGQSQAEEEQSQASFFGDESDALSYFTTIDPNDKAAIQELAESYSEKDLMYFFDHTHIASMLYPGKKMTYGQAMANIKRMTKETKVRRLAELGFNFDTESFP